MSLHSFGNATVAGWKGELRAIHAQADQLRRIISQGKSVEAARDCTLMPGVADNLMFSANAAKNEFKTLVMNLRSSTPRLCVALGVGYLQDCHHIDVYKSGSLKITFCDAGFQVLSADPLDGLMDYMYIYPEPYWWPVPNEWQPFTVVSGGLVLSSSLWSNFESVPTNALLDHTYEVRMYKS